MEPCLCGDPACQKCFPGNRESCDFPITSAEIGTWLKNEGQILYMFEKVTYLRQKLMMARRKLESFEKDN